MTRKNNFLKTFFPVKDALSSKKNFYILIVMALIYTLAWSMQSHLFLNWDVSWLTLAAQRLMNGGTYTHDFFETNPPLILYLYMPPVILSKLLNINIILIFRGYIFLIASLSLLICYAFICKILLKRDTLIALCFLFSLAVAYLMLPLYEFGQRDHLLVLLTMPYFLMAVWRLQPDFTPKNSLFLIGGVIGLLAGIGFALKPHFLITPFLIESYFIFRRKNLLAWIRTETLIIIAFIITYISSIFVFFPDYVHMMIPYTFRLYYGSVGYSWHDMLFFRFAIFCWIPIPFYLAIYKTNPYKTLNTVLLLVLISFLFSYFSQRTLFYYHIIPAFAIAIVLLTLLFSIIIMQFCKNTLAHFFAGVSALLFFICPLLLLSLLYQGNIEYKNKVIKKDIAFLRGYASHHSVYFFSTTGAFAFPAFNYYTTAAVAPRFYFLWMLPTLVNQKISSPQQTKDKNFLIEMIAEDLCIHQPDFIFVDTSIPKPRINDIHFEYLNYFSTNRHFRKEWSKYRYFITFAQKDLYQFRVYKRLTNKNTRMNLTRRTYPIVTTITRKIRHRLHSPGISSVHANSQS